MDEKTDVLLLEYNKPSKKCSDHDRDCVHVQDYFSCWSGGVCNVLVNGVIKEVELDPADGYCPFVKTWKRHSP